MFQNVRNWAAAWQSPQHRSREGSGAATSLCCLCWCTNPPQPESCHPDHWVSAVATISTDWHCDSHALCQNYLFFIQSLFQPGLDAFLHLEIFAGGGLWLSWPAGHILWSAGSPTEGHIALVLVRPKWTDTIMNCESFLACPSHIQTAMLCDLQSCSLASLQSYLMPLLQVSIDFCCCITQSTLHSAKFKQEKNAALVTPWVVYKRLRIPCCLFSHKIQCVFWQSQWSQ